MGKFFDYWAGFFPHLGEGGRHSTPGGWQQTKIKRAGIFSKNEDIGVKF